MNSVNKVIFAVARKAPALLRLIAAPQARQIKRSPEKVIDKTARNKHVPDADRAVMSDPRTRAFMIAAAPEMFRQGTRGFVQEAHLTVTPWGFDPAAIKLPVSFWHGDADKNVPIDSMQRLSSMVTQSSVTIYPGEGHLIVPRHWDAIIDSLLSHESPQI
jgi:pimeloyl-ACP methyl ester carboxylesterase